MDNIPAKTIISQYIEGGWFGSCYTMNIYRGCSHGCIYCDSRSDCYRIDDFDTVRAKENALGIIERDLRAKRKKGIVMTGAMSDPYNPCEETRRLTRGALTLLDKYGFGAAIDTKSPLAARDADILHDISLHSPAVVSFTVTTADDQLCRMLERDVSPTSGRLRALEALSREGITCGVLLMPILPFINDTEENILSIVRQAHNAGAQWIYSTGFGVTLRQNQRLYFLNQAERLFPGIKKRYISSFGDSYECHSPENSRLWQVFSAECERLGLPYRMEEITGRIALPYSGKHRQTTLFDGDGA